MAKSNKIESAAEDTYTKIEIARFNLDAMRGELERTRLLLKIATEVNYIETGLAQQVRDIALQALLRTLTPEMEVIDDGQGGDLGE
jgi:hypothetical protein